MPAKDDQVAGQIWTIRESLKLLQLKQDAKEVKETKQEEKQKLRTEKAREKELAKLNLNVSNYASK